MGTAEPKVAVPLTPFMSLSTTMKVTYFHLRPHDIQVSIGRMFTEVRNSLPPSIRPRVAVSTFRSRGFWPRVYNMLEATFRQGNVNHVTGDVHYLTLLLRRRRTLLTILDCVSLERLAGFRWWLFFLFWYWLPAKRSALISVISESTKKELLRYLKYDPQRIRVVYCPCRQEFNATPKEFNVQKPVILQVGTGANKNLRRVAEALQGIPCRLRIIGKLTKEQALTLQECRIDYSAVAGISDEELVREYQQCDLLVFVSTYEGFGMPIIEANATGRPVVTSNILSMPEVAGEAAAFADPFDVMSIRQSILRVIEDGNFRDTIVRLGYENIKRFKPERIASEYVKIYRELASR
jgi:glycosyltransferase involved in cell wall biosynthesis